MKKILISIFIMLCIQLGAFAQRVNVAFTIDNNYPLFTLLAINSILVNNKSNSDYMFYIVENNITDRNKRFMEKFVTNMGQQIEFINIDTSIIDNGTYYYTFSEGKRITKIGMARILLPEFLPETVHRVIYLDGDILVTGDLSELYNSDLGGKSTGMSDNIGLLEYTKYKFKNYYNSGMIVMDLDKWRKSKIPDKMLEYLNTNKESFIYNGEHDNSKFLYPDQDLINIVLDGNIKTLEQRWNNQTIRMLHVEEFDKKGIIHYIGPHKPWHFSYISNPGIKMYYEYWKASPLRNYIYLYKYKSVQRLYVNVCRRKYNRYKIVLRSIKQGKFTFLY